MSATTTHPCARCARVQKTCCERTEILVTAGDVGRIRTAIGRDDFWSTRVPTDESYLEQDPTDPNWRDLTVDARDRRKMLRQTADGRCVFLGESGCRLDTETRPLICRLYPYAYSEDGLTGIDDHYCPTNLLLEHPGDSMLRVLDMREDDAIRWHRTLYRELREERERSEDRPHL